MTETEALAARTELQLLDLKELLPKLPVGEKREAIAFHIKKAQEALEKYHLARCGDGWGGGYSVGFDLAKRADATAHELVKLAHRNPVSAATRLPLTDSDPRKPIAAIRDAEARLEGFDVRKNAGVEVDSRQRESARQSAAFLDMLPAKPLPPGIFTGAQPGDETAREAAEERLGCTVEEFEAGLRDPHGVGARLERERVVKAIREAHKRPIAVRGPGHGWR